MQDSRIILPMGLPALILIRGSLASALSMETIVFRFGHSDG